MPSAIGRPARRREDPRLITGRGRYSGDIRLDGLVHLAVARSPLPHARITSIDLAPAQAVPGVVAAWTAADLPETAREFADWVPRGMKTRARPVLAAEEVNHVGDPVAVVVASDVYTARDAADAVFADLDPLPAVGTVDAALADGAPLVHDDLGSNVMGSSKRAYGDIEAAFAGDSIAIRERFKLARICGAAMEPRAVTATFDGKKLTVWTSTQHTYGVRDRLNEMLGLEKERVEVLAEDVGGGFGPKATSYPEEILVALAALRLQKPVRWTATRSEDTTTTVHAHGSSFDLELAAGPDGRLRGLRGRLWHDVGAYPASGSNQPSLITAHMVSAYHLPAMKVDYDLVLTNTASTGFVRGGGRPLGNFAIERLMDRLARRLDLDPAEIRRRNLVQPEEMPYSTGLKDVIYDAGDYPRLLETALERGGYGELRKRQREPRQGKLLGVGLACCVESSGWGTEPARLRVEKDGGAHLFIGSTPQGQGHLTAAAQVLADRLGWPEDRIEVTAGDTGAVSWGQMTAGSRTAVQVGNATALAAGSARRWLLEHAAETLEANPADLVLEDGVISVKGTPSSSLPAADVLPAAGLEVVETFEPELANAYSSGCHLAVVEVDPETGGVDIVRYVIVHDTGQAINPLLVDGQLHGGYAHGLGYALFEEAVYQPDGGFQSASFLDYTIASAPELSVTPELVSLGTPTPHNPEGFKGAGESGTIPAPAAIANAVEDAIRQLRPEAVVRELPISPARLFETLG